MVIAARRDGPARVVIGSAILNPNDADTAVAHSEPEAGFSLIEALVAMAIAALAMTAIYGVIGTGVRAEARVRAQMEVATIARSHIDALGTDGALAPGESTGRYGNGIAWRLTVTELPGKEGGKARAVWLSLQTFDSAGRPIVGFETAKVTPLPP
jgi:general secretion pathway protein I